MILGNSNGNNRGKKYLTKTLIKEIDAVYACKAENFNNWIQNNYESLVNYLIDKDIYDLDVFMYTYERMYTSILYKGFKVNNYRSYFCRSYYTNRIQNLINNGLFEELPADVNCAIEYEYSESEDEEKAILINDIMNYVYENYKTKDFEIFKMYMNLKPAINFKKLEAITGLKEGNLRYIVSRIKKDVMEKFKEKRNKTL